MVADIFICGNGKLHSAYRIRGRMEIPFVKFRRRVRAYLDGFNQFIFDDKFFTKEYRCGFRSALVYLFNRNPFAGFRSALGVFPYFVPQSQKKGDGGGYGGGKIKGYAVRAM